MKKLAPHSTEASQAVKNTNCLLISRYQLEIVAAQEMQEFTALNKEELTISNRYGEYMQDNTTQSIYDNSIKCVKYLIIWVMNDKKKTVLLSKLCFTSSTITRRLANQLTLPKL